MLRRFLHSDSLLADASTTLVVRAAGIALMFGMTTLTARLLGADEYGTFSAAWALAILLATLVPVGSDRILVRNLSTVTSPQQAGPDNALAHLCTALTAGLLFVGGSLLAVLPASAAIDASWRRTLLLALLLFLPIALTYLRQWVAIPLVGTRIAVAPEQIVLPLLFTALLSVLHVLWKPITATGAVAALAVCLAAVWAGSLNHRVLRTAYRAALSARVRPGDVRGRMQDGLPFVSVSIGAVILQRCLPLVIAAACGFQATALFAIGLQYAALPEIPLGIVNLCMIPRCARCFHQGDAAAAQHVVRLAATLTFGVALVLSLLTWLVAPALLALLGQSFRGVEAIFPTLLLAAIVNAVAGPAIPVMQTMKLESLYSRLLYGFLPVQLLLIWLGSRVADLEGAACGYLLARCSWNLLLIVAIRRTRRLWCVPFTRLSQIVRVPRGRDTSVAPSPSPPGSAVAA